MVGIAPADVVAAAAARIAAAAAGTESFLPLPTSEQTNSGRNVVCHPSHVHAERPVSDKESTRVPHAAQ